MVTTKGSKNVPIRGELVMQLEKQFNRKIQNRLISEKTRFGSYVNDILMDVLEKDKFLAITMPYYSLAGHDANTLFIKDEKRDRVAEVYLRDSTLYCALDESQDCEHIHFAYAIPEVAKLNIKHPNTDF